MDFRYLGICGRRRGSIGASLILALVTGGIDRGGYFFPLSCIESRYIRVISRVEGWSGRLALYSAGA